jgi:hypothetical protein
LSTKYLNPIPPKEGVHKAAFERYNAKLIEESNTKLGLSALSACSVLTLQKRDWPSTNA